MNTIIYVSAVYVVYIASIYAVLHVIIKHERKHHVRHILTILSAALFSWLASIFLKNTIAFPRQDLTHALFIPSDPYTFPSGHAMFMFALAFAMYSFDRPAGKILFIMASITGVARVLAGVHYWYDIVGGIILAWLMANLVTSIAKKFF